MIHSIDRDRWCAPIFFHSLCVYTVQRIVIGFSLTNNREMSSARKNEIQTKTISLWLLLYYYCCCSAAVNTLFIQCKRQPLRSLPQSFCISVSFPRYDHYSRIAQILFIANECWMITAPSEPNSISLALSLSGIEKRSKPNGVEQVPL